MNTLSWLLYLGDVCEAIRTVCTMLAFCLVILLGITFAAEVAENFTLISESSKKLATATLVGAILVAVLTPSQRTIYMIAASELGERAATSDAGKAVSDEVRKLVLGKLKKLNEAAQ